jgi:superfamily I DNA/RNA helicase
MNNTYEDIEKVLLPKGCTFTENQRESLLADGNYNIVAGPGSGKTTVLTAKIAYLLLNRKKADKGVCLITHTNVAVEEVLKNLKLLGINSIEYPNFVGTIQEFFNHFFSIKAFNSLTRNKNIRILDDDEYKIMLEPIFRAEVPKYSSDYTIPNLKNHNACLQVNSNNQVYFTNSGSHFFNSGMNRALLKMFNRGMVTNKQCLELADWYLKKHLEPLRKAIEGRFSYILLDEAQDTSDLQYKLLMEITNNSKIKFQKYGDPYQGLYSIYEDDKEDTWIPNNEIVYGIETKEIAETTRFGEDISTIVKWVCMENYEHFKSLNVVKSLKPHFLVFNSRVQLIEKYERIISYYEQFNSDFKQCNKKDVIVSDMHSNLEKYFVSYSKEKKIKRTTEYNFIWLYNYLIGKLAKLNGKSQQEMKKIFSEDLTKSMSIAELINELNSDNITETNITSLIKKVFNRVSGEDIVSLSTEIINQVTIVKNFNKENDEKEKFSLNTIHGVKGETHRSTMLIVDSSLNYQNTQKNSFFEIIKYNLIGQRTHKNEDTNLDEVIKALKLAYVGLSRAKYLIIVAIPEADIDSFYKKQLRDKGWLECE